MSTVCCSTKREHEQPQEGIWFLMVTKMLIRPILSRQVPPPNWRGHCHCPQLSEEDSQGREAFAQGQAAVRSGAYLEPKLL